jgi:hypothetical protein
MRVKDLLILLLIYWIDLYFEGNGTVWKIANNNKAVKYLMNCVTQLNECHWRIFKNNSKFILKISNKNNVYRRSGIIQSYPQFLAKMSYWQIINEQMML